MLTVSAISAGISIKCLKAKDPQGTRFRQINGDIELTSKVLKRDRILRNQQRHELNSKVLRGGRISPKQRRHQLCDKIVERR